MLKSLSKKVREKAWDELNRRCFNADCENCMKSKPMCKFSRLKMFQMICQERENDAHPSIGYPASISRDAYSEFASHRQRERDARKEEKEKRELKEYRKLKRQGKV